MAINKNVFLHESDKAALQALQAIPGFASLMKSYMKAFNEKIFYIQNMSTNVQINDSQLKKYHDMLIPICEKLGIDIPELFLQQNPYPNSYTSGDNKPFIVITSGLIETLPERLIPTVLAHECGHIACQHVLYRTMGQMIINGAIFSLLGQGISAFLSIPIRAAFYYWMRCSEYSADRAAILCDGSPDNMIEVCARLAGFGGINEEINMDSFIKQASEYRKMINDSSINKTLEYMNYGFSTHPLNAIRAYEANKWSKSENFIKAKQYFDAYKNNVTPKQIPISFEEKDFIYKNYLDVKKELEDAGFNVNLTRDYDNKRHVKQDSVLNVYINDSNNYKDGDWIDLDSKVDLIYHKVLSEDEIAKAHAGQIKLNNPSSHYIGKNYKDVEMELLKQGIVNTRSIALNDLNNYNDRLLNKVAQITVNDRKRFNKDEWVDMMAQFSIYYHSCKE